MFTRRFRLPPALVRHRRRGGRTRSADYGAARAAAAGGGRCAAGPVFVILNRCDHQRAIARNPRVLGRSRPWSAGLHGQIRRLRIAGGRRDGQRSLRISGRGVVERDPGRAPGEPGGHDELRAIAPLSLSFSLVGASRIAVISPEGYGRRAHSGRRRWPRNRCTASSFPYRPSGRGRCRWPPG